MIAPPDDFPSANVVHETPASLHVLHANTARTFRHGSFQIRRVRPGLILGPTADPAFGPLSVVDHAQLGVGTIVSMHEHTNDEILTYLRSGVMLHTDSDGVRVTVSPDRLMLMNAGRSFWHEESVPELAVEALQIFIRPQEANLPGTVQFHEPPTVGDTWSWRLIGGPRSSAARLKIRQQVLVYDAQLAAGQTLPVPAVDRFAPWLYVMEGTIRVGTARLNKGDAATDLEAALPSVHAESQARLVLFFVDRNARAVRVGTISGL